MQNKVQLPGLFNPRTFIQLQLGLSPGQIGLLGNDFGNNNGHGRGEGGGGGGLAAGLDNNTVLNSK